MKLPDPHRSIGLLHDESALESARSAGATLASQGLRVSVFDANHEHDAIAAVERAAIEQMNDGDRTIEPEDWRKQARQALRVGGGVVVITWNDNSRATDTDFWRVHGQPE